MLKQGEGVGCASQFALFNMLLMGAIALSFASGPFSSFEQELWYRYGSVGFLLLGGIIPAVGLWIGRGRPSVVTIATVWMFFALLTFVGYIYRAGGGV